MISPGQTFGDLTQKATDYLQAGVDMWVVDPKPQSVTVLHGDRLPQTVKADGSLSDPLLPELELPISCLFVKRLGENR